MHFSVLIPIYNEESSLPSLLEGLKRALQALDADHEVIFINDGSTDGTGRSLDEAAEAEARFKVIHFSRNFGQAAALMAGMDHAQGEVIVCMDGDGQNDPADIGLLLERIKAGDDVCSGWRRDRQDTFLTRVLPSRIANWLIARTTGVALHDLGCSLKAYRRQILEGVRLYGETHRFIPIYASWRGARISEIPVRHHARAHGQSKYGLDRVFKVVLDLLVILFTARYVQKPIYVFGGFGLAAIGGSLACFAAMLYYKFTGQKDFVETPLPLLVVMLFLMGFMTLLMGLLADLVMRTYYESQSKPTYVVHSRRNLGEKT